MTKSEARYFAKLLTTVTDDCYIVEPEGIENDYLVYRVVTGGGKPIVQSYGNIRTKLEYAMRMCRNGLAQL